MPAAYELILSEPFVITPRPFPKTEALERSEKGSITLSKMSSAEPPFLLLLSVKAAKISGFQVCNKGIVIKKKNIGIITFNKRTPEFLNATRKTPTTVITNKPKTALLPPVLKHPINKSNPIIKKLNFLFKNFCLKFDFKK